MPHIVAFDFDGTLLDSRARHMVALDDILRQSGISIDVSGLIEFKRGGLNNIDFLTTNGIDKATAVEIQSKWVDVIETEKYLALDTMYADALDLLKLKGMNADLVLITARKNVHGLYSQLDKFELGGYFRDVYVVAPGPSASAAKAEILSHIGAQCVIGDTASDARAAKIAGIDFIFHENGFHNKETALGV